MTISLIVVLGTGWLFESRPASDPTTRLTVSKPVGKPGPAGGEGTSHRESGTMALALALAACSSNPPGEQQLVVSITLQTLWACDGTHSVNTSPVTTGSDNATPTGTFYIQAKEGPQYLNGCNDTGCWHDYVHVWMPFDGAYGFHDAPWQTVPFGSPAYTTQGSHGCVHLPEAEANWMFNWVVLGARVTVEA